MCGPPQDSPLACPTPPLLERKVWKRGNKGLSTFGLDLLLAPENQGFLLLVLHILVLNLSLLKKSLQNMIFFSKTPCRVVGMIPCFQNFLKLGSRVGGGKSLYLKTQN